MAPRSLAAVAAVCGSLVACGSGSGPLVTTTTEGRDPPSTGRDTPPSSQDEPNASGGGSGGDCISCDIDYSCSGGGLSETISLSSADGECTAALRSVVCSGAVFGTAPCSGGGGGSFTCGAVTCTPEDQIGEPGTGTGTSNGNCTGSSSGCASPPSSG